MVADTTHSTQQENWSTSFSLRPACDKQDAWGTPGVRKTEVLSKYDRRACNAGRTCMNSGVFSPEGVLTTQEAPTLHLLPKYVLTKRG